MKKLLIGLILLSSFAAFSNPCTITITREGSVNDNYFKMKQLLTEVMRVYGYRIEQDFNKAEFELSPLGGVSYIGFFLDSAYDRTREYSLQLKEVSSGYTEKVTGYDTGGNVFVGASPKVALKDALEQIPLCSNQNVDLDKVLNKEKYSSLFEEGMIRIN